MITYNQEKFIAQAVDSVLMQETDFDFEIVIGEDCSADATPDILKQYQQKHPKRIRLLLRKANLGVHRNFVDALAASQGQYAAALEGDDYWTSPHKLQEQVNFLDSHPECAICFHDATKFYEDGSREPAAYCPADQKEISTVEDLLVKNFIPFCTVMFRQRLFAPFPDWYYDLSMGDWPLHILNAEHGNIGYINEVMAAYRIHEQGVWSRLDKIQMLQGFIKLFEQLKAHLDARYRRQIRTTLANYCYDLAVQYENNGDLPNAKAYATRAFTERPFNARTSERQLFRMLLRLHAPALYRIIKALAPKAGPRESSP